MAASNLQTTVTDKPREVTANSEGALARARQLMAGAVGVDSHIDTIQRVLVMGEDLGKRHDAGQVDIPRLREGAMGSLRRAAAFHSLRTLSAIAAIGCSGGTDSQDEVVCRAGAAVLK